MGVGAPVIVTAIMGASFALSARAGIATWAEGSRDRLLGASASAPTVFAPLGDGWSLERDALTRETGRIQTNLHEQVHTPSAVVSSAQLIGTMLTSAATDAGTLATQSLGPKSLRPASEDASRVRSDELSRAVGPRRWSVVAEGPADQALTGTSVPVPSGTRSRRR